MLASLPPDYWSAEAAAHLALRAGFGQTPDESKKWSQQGMEAMLDHLLQTPGDNVAPPEWAYPTRDEDLLQRIRNPATTPEEKAQVQRDLNIRKSDHMADLINWWTLRMARSPAPLVEKMTLFWHGHFATSADKVSAYRMWLQNETIRRYALSNFGILVKAISCDPAMINWLDLGSSQKEHPNENFARELMELLLWERDITQRTMSKRLLARLPGIGWLARRNSSGSWPASLINLIRLSSVKPGPGAAIKSSTSSCPSRSVQNLLLPRSGVSLSTMIQRRS